MLFSTPPLPVLQNLSHRETLSPRWQGEWGADVRLFVATTVRWAKKKSCRNKKKRDIILILAREGQPGSRVYMGGEASFGRDGTWVSVSGVLVKVVAIKGAGRTINQQQPKGGAGALTRTLHSARDTHRPADRLAHCFPPLSFTPVLAAYLVSSTLSSFLFSSPFLCPLSPWLFSRCLALILPPPLLSSPLTFIYNREPLWSKSLESFLRPDSWLQTLQELGVSWGCSRRQVRREEK